MNARACRHPRRKRRTVGLDVIDAMTLPPELRQTAGIFGGPGPAMAPSSFSNALETIECGKCGARWTVSARVVF